MAYIYGRPKEVITIKGKYGRANNRMMELANVYELAVQRDALALVSWDFFGKTMPPIMRWFNLHSVFSPRYLAVASLSSARLNSIFTWVDVRLSPTGEILSVVKPPPSNSASNVSVPTSVPTRVPSPNGSSRSSASSVRSASQPTAKRSTTGPLNTTDPLSQTEEAWRNTTVSPRWIRITAGDIFRRGGVNIRNAGHRLIGIRYSCYVRLLAAEVFPLLDACGDPIVPYIGVHLRWMEGG
jgi:hypothetical protein